MGVKGSWQRPDDGNYRAKYDGIDWSAKGEKPKEAEKDEEQKEDEDDD